jgi:hypothetical protein
LEEPRPSATGKTLLIGSTRGVRRSGARFKGQTIFIVANAFIYPPDGVADSSFGKQSKNRVQENEGDEDDDEQNDDDEDER